MLRRLGRKNRRGHQSAAPAEPPEAPVSVAPVTVAEPPPMPVNQSVPPPEPAPSLDQVEDLLRRLNQSVQAGTTAQIRLAERLETHLQGAGPAGFQVNQAFPADVMQSLGELPSAIRVASELPRKTVAALDRIEGLAHTIRSQQQLQQQAADDLSGMRQDLQKFLGTVATAVSELTELHKAALDQCARMATSQREVLHSHRMHAVELQRLHDTARHELAEEHFQRQRDYEQRVRQVGRKITVAVTVLCLTVLFSAMVANGVIDLRAAFRSPQASKSAPAARPGEHELRLPDSSQPTVGRDQPDGRAAQ